MSVISNSMQKKDWVLVDEISATGATGTGNSKTVSSMPSTATELMIRLWVGGGVVSSSVGFLTDGAISARHTYAPNSQVVTQSVNTNFNTSTGFFQVYINYAASSIEVKGELYYR